LFLYGNIWRLERLELNVLGQCPEKPQYDALSQKRRRFGRGIRMQQQRHASDADGYIFTVRRVLVFSGIRQLERMELDLLCKRYQKQKYDRLPQK